MESMSNAPYLLARAARNTSVDPGQLVDSMVKDGLWDVYNDFHMGAAAELCSDEWNISRQEQDAYAIRSYQKAIAAQRGGRFGNEIVPVSGAGAALDDDEELRRFDPEKLRSLRPAFKENGTITAGNASSISDGAAALAVMERKKALSMGLAPMARIVGYAASAREPEWFSIAPVEAIQSLMLKTGRRLSDVDLFEINEAFSASSIAVERKLDLDPDKVNVRGGAVALGHPIGASGARILATLVHSLADLGKTVGVASLCIGGGEAVSLMVERI
jgi:acetyl-CoA C-acetyltransferase